MNRLAIGAVLGGLAVYLYDPELGENRRGRLISLWQENRNVALRAGRTASETMDSARPLARRVTKAIGRADWAEAFERRRPAASLPRLIVAAAAGGAVVYFMDPLKGTERRLSAIGAGRRAFHRIAEMVKFVPGHPEDQVTGAAEHVKFKLS
jgi:3-deoxy-D-arabino-heptulosonate 7-phosphate (DAHP) synthase class II